MVFRTAFPESVSENQPIEHECLLAHPALDVVDHSGHPLASLDLSECPHRTGVDALHSHRSTAETC